MDSIIQALQQKKAAGQLQEIADNTRLHVSSLYRIVNRERQPRLDTIKKLLRVYPDFAPDLAAALFTPTNSPTSDDARQSS